MLGPPVSTGGLATPEVPARALFVAGGVGITPIISHLRRLARSGTAEDVVPLYFNHDRRSIIFQREITELGSLPGITVHVLAGLRPLAGTARRPGPRRARPGDVRLCARRSRRRAGLSTAAGQAPERLRTESPPHRHLDRAADDGSRYRVTFARSRRSVEVDGGTTL